VTLVHFGPTFDKRIKPWVLPDLENRIREGGIAARWNSRIARIEGEHVCVMTDERMERLEATRVYLLTGFAPDMELLRAVGVPIDAQSGIPKHDPETLETSVPGVFIAGVVVAGFDANKVFIENGRYHGDKIVARILGQRPPREPELSAELDT
jgi:thioredoxin reductase (NADPH)